MTGPEKTFKPVSDWHILHLFPSSSWGGAEIQAVELADWQREAGIDSKIWCVAGSPMHKECERRKIPVVLDLFPLKGSVPRVFTLLRVLKRENTTHLHVHWAAGIRLVYGIKYFYPVKLIFYTHMWITRRKKSFIHRLAYRHLDKATVSGPRALENVVKFLPWQSEQLELCSYGIDFRRIQKGLRDGVKPKKDLREKWQLPKDAVVFGFFGRIDRQKGVREFLVAAEEALKNHSQLHLLLVGDPTLNEKEAIEYKEEIDRLVEKSLYKNRIHRFGHQSDFHTPLSTVDVLVLPSYMECYSILIVHSFALGIPVVSTDAGGTPDLISPPQRGWLVPSRDIIELGSLLNHLASNLKEVQGKSEACSSYATENHSHINVVRRMTEIYQAALKT